MGTHLYKRVQLTTPISALVRFIAVHGNIAVENIRNTIFKKFQNCNLMLLDTLARRT